jgi:hypothetical protein
MHPFAEHAAHLDRRRFFSSARYGIGAAALASLVGPPMLGPRTAVAADQPSRVGGLPGVPHFAPRAKRAIYLFMAGAPAQHDTLDYKPTMADWFDKDLPESIRKGQRLTTMTSGQKRFPIAPSKYKFEQHGESGTWVSELLPNMAKLTDDFALVKSVHTEAINHDPAITYICTGAQLPGKASLGAWLQYGLGTENENLPAFVVLTSRWSSKRDAQALYNRLWGNGFLPSKFQGVSLRSEGDPVLFLRNPAGVNETIRRRMVESVANLNRQRYEIAWDPEILARTKQYEMAFRMQTSVPELADLASESQATFDLYGEEAKEPGTFAASALLARRMIERGVRFVQIFHRGWDQHGSLPRDLPLQCGDVDRASYALVKDLEERGLLDDTLVIWGGEFGRTIYCQGTLTKENYGRDHHPRCFPVWMAGGGIKEGVVHGETDEFGYNVVENPVHVRDLNATILHQLGIDHARLTYPFQGLDQRLTGVEEEARVVREILA